MNTQTITAEILDSHTTPGELVIELPGEEYVRVELAEWDENGLDNALTALVAALAKAGYAFAGEPTNECGDVELVTL